jgi:uncharacterized protein YprB with RNaseH-like and TPR domain
VVAPSGSRGTGGDGGVGRDRGTGSRSRRDKLRRAFRGEAEQRLREQSQRDHEQSDQDQRDRAAAGSGLRAFRQQRRQRLAAGLPAVAPRQPVHLPDAEVVATGHGPLWLRRLRYPLSHRHGDIELLRGTRFDPARLATMAKSPSFAQLRPEECLFLDTETTGLAGGAGTVVFAYGLAWFEPDALVFEQLFLRDFGEEPAMLHHLATRMGEHPVPVTFVGKSYDRHRIAARLAVHKITAPVLTDRHLDLYHVIRRAFGKQWPDSRLRTAEERLLRLVRHDDLPGSEAPAAFLDWIRDGTGPVDRVLEHNRLDVLSLAALLGVVTG